MAETATSSGPNSVIMEGLQDMTECKICSEIFTDPRFLPCLHTFCLKCLQDFAAGSAGNRKDLISCPLCRKEFAIPAEGMAGFPRNFLMKRIVEITKISAPSEEPSPCDVCTDNNDETAGVERTAATMYCIQCREKLCDRCCIEHRRQKPCRSHRVVEIGCHVDALLEGNREIGICEFHSAKLMDMYCMNCKAVICIMCFAESHKSHDCSDIRKAAEKFQVDIDSDIGQMIGFPGEALLRKEQLEQEKREFIRELAEAERMIKSRGEQLKGVVDEHIARLVEELNVVEQKTFKVMDTEKDELERHLVVTERLLSYCREVKTMGSPEEICSAIGDLHARTRDLINLHKTQIQQKSLPSLSVSFKAKDLDGLLKTSNIVGKIEVNEKKQLSKRSTYPTPPMFLWVAIVVLLVATFSSWKYDVSEVSRHITSFNSDCAELAGMLSLQNSIFLLCSEPNRIYKYEAQTPFIMLEQWIIPDRIHPTDMVTSSASEYFYILDFDNQCIWKWKPGESKFMMWLRIRVWDQQISVTRDGYVVVALRNPSRLCLYNSDAALVHTIPMSEQNQFVSPVHVVETYNGNFIVSCTLAGVGNWGICELTREGNIVQCFKSLDNNQELKSPSHLSLTSKGRLFVADTENNRIVLLNSDLAWNRILLSGGKDGLLMPRKLIYKDDTKELIVGQENGRLHVYVLK